MHVKTGKFRKKQIIIAWSLVFPALALRLITSAYPIIRTVMYSFYNFRGSAKNMKFAGFENYARILNDIGITQTLQFSAIFTIAATLSIIVFGYMLALLINTKFKGKKFLRSIVLIPWAIPGIVAGIAAQWAFNDTYGFINDLIARFFIPGFNLPWLVTVDRARFAVILVDVWKNVSFFAILILAGLQSIPGETYESAKMDGAGVFTIFFRIILPHLKKLTVTLSVFFILWRLTQYDLIYAMTAGGPGSATSLISHKVMLEAFKNMNYGYASAVATVLFLVMLVIASTGIFMQSRMDD